MKPEPISVLTIDLEDWFHLIGIGLDPEDWAGIESRVDRPLDWLLELLGATDRRATFYCLGWLAHRRPDLVSRIASEGHDIGTHSYWHRPLSDLDPVTFRHDLLDSIAAIEDAAQRPVTTYRAPGFSLTAAEAWAGEILVEAGITVDSSIALGFHFHGGVRDFPARGPAIVETRAGALKEFPLSGFGVGRARLCLTGGGFFRATPASVVAHLAWHQRYAMLYFHPRDFDPDMPLLPGLGAGRRFRQRLGLRTARRKFGKLLLALDTCTVAEATERVDWSAVPRIVWARNSKSADYSPQDLKRQFQVVCEE